MLDIVIAFNPDITGWRLGFFESASIVDGERFMSDAFHLGPLVIQFKRV